VPTATAAQAPSSSLDRIRARCVRHGAVLLGLMISAPMIVIAVRAWFAGWAPPLGDVSLIALRVRDVGTASTPWLGSYGRYGFNHPGPLWFDLLAPSYRLTGHLEPAVALVGVASVLTITTVAARHGRLLWAAALLAIYVHGIGPLRLVDAWEPHGLLLPAAALVLLTIDVLTGADRMLPVVAGVASLLAAAQATLLPYALACGALALVATITRRAAGRRRALILTGVVLAVLWAPTIIQQIAGDRPNLSAMLEARGGPPGSLGLADAWRLVANEWSLRAPWLGFDLPLEPFRPVVDLAALHVVPVAGVLLVAAALRWRHRATWPAIAAAAAGVLAMSQLLGPVFPWIPQWLRVVGFSAWLGAGWAVAGRIPRSVLIGVVVVFTGLTGAAAISADREPDRLGTAIRSLVDGRTIPDGTVLVRSSIDADLVFGGGGVGVEVLALELDRRGVDVVVDPDLADRFGEARAEPARATVTLELVEVARGGVDPLEPQLRRRRDALLERIGLGPEPTAADLLTRYRADPTVRTAIEDLAAIPNLPRINLRVRPRTG